MNRTAVRCAQKWLASFSGMRGAEAPKKASTEGACIQANSLRASSPHRLSLADSSPAARVRFAG
jgi:hypothetical protein